jgi:hypothetical protein
MKTALKLEELAQFLFSIYLFTLLPFAWWVYPLFFFAPDLSMLGYLGGPRAGAIVYNLVHRKAISLALIAVGFSWLSQSFPRRGDHLRHSSLDRVLLRPEVP